jgi:acylphosphatase
MTERRRFRVEGQVQGVGFRVFTAKTANQLGLAGWVCNRLDGSVELMAEGPAETLQALIHALHRGPNGARVDMVRALEGDVTEPGLDEDMPAIFEIWPTR